MIWLIALFCFGVVSIILGISLAKAAAPYHRKDRIIDDLQQAKFVCKGNTDELDKMLRDYINTITSGSPVIRK
jgi:hypothetical protein